MPRTSKGGLRGGRALYTGKNAYASQGFENDTRQTTLGGLAACYLVADRNNTAADATAIVWGAGIISLGNANTTPTHNVFLRGFSLLSDGATLQCRTPGTYRIQGGVRCASVPVSTVVIARVQVTRSNSLIYSVAAVSQNVSATVVGGQVDINTLPALLDLQSGDFIQLIIQGLTAGTVSLGASYGTGLYLEQLDIQA